MAAEQSQYNKKRIAAFGALVLLFLILLFLIWWWWLRPAPQPTNTNQPQQPVSTTVVTVQPQPVNTNIPKPVAPDEGELQVTSLARIFAERYGSWSTDSNYQNLRDLFPRVTPPLQSQFEQTMRQPIADEDFKGISTQVITITIQSRTTAAATVLVKTQRVQTDVRLHETVAYQDLLLTMVKVRDFWYVDSATWK